MGAFVRDYITAAEAIAAVEGEATLVLASGTTIGGNTATHAGNLDSQVEALTALNLHANTTINSSAILSKANAPEVWTAEIPCSAAVAAGNAITLTMEGPDDTAWTITDIALYYTTKATSAAGTYLFTAAAAGNNLLSAASYDLEGITNATLTEMSLTGTAAHLAIAADGRATFTFTSNNADLTGGTGAWIRVTWTRT